MILCGASESIFADALVQQICDGGFLHFKNEIEFTRWLFKQPRVSTMSDIVLVAGFREAKPCMDAIIAMRSGDTSKLRTDPKRPQLSQAAPGAEISAAVAEMVVAVQTSHQKKRAAKWADAGQLDPNVRTCIVMGAEQVTDIVAAALLGGRVKHEDDILSSLEKQENMERPSDNLKEPYAAKELLPACVAASPACKLWADMNDDDDWSDLMRAFSSLLEEEEEETLEMTSRSNFKDPSAAKEQPLRRMSASRHGTSTECVFGLTFTV